MPVGNIARIKSRLPTKKTVGKRFEIEELSTGN